MKQKRYGAGFNVIDSIILSSPYVLQKGSKYCVELINHNITSIENLIVKDYDSNGDLINEQQISGSVQKFLSSNNIFCFSPIEDFNNAKFYNGDTEIGVKVSQCNDILKDQIVNNLFIETNLFNVAIVINNDVFFPDARGYLDLKDYLINYVGLVPRYDNDISGFIFFSYEEDK